MGASAERGGDGAARRGGGSARRPAQHVEHDLLKARAMARHASADGPHYARPTSAAKISLAGARDMRYNARHNPRVGEIRQRRTAETWAAATSRWAERAKAVAAASKGGSHRG